MKTQIHQTQQHYRQLIDIFSYPGKMLQSNETVNNYSTYCNATLMTAMTLLDNEVTFHTALKSDGQEIATLTGGEFTSEVNRSDYVIVKEKDLSAAIFEDVQIGKLASPEKSATLIVELENLEAGNIYRLSGPGIKETAMIQISLDHKWMDRRNEKCKEYPLGIDLILIDDENNMMSIPRTTKVEVV